MHKYIAALVVSICFAAGAAVAADDPFAGERSPDRHGVFIAKPENDVYFLGKSGEHLLFNSRPYQPFSNWHTAPTALYVIDAKTGAELSKIPTDLSVAFTRDPQGRRVACGDTGSDGAHVFRIYDVETGKVVDEHRGGAGEPRGMHEWSPDGRLFTFEGQYPTILNVYDTKTKTSRLLRKNRFAQIHSPVWAPDSKTLAFLEDHANILSQTHREIHIVDGDPESPQFGEEKQLVELNRGDIKTMWRIEWAGQDHMVGSYRDEHGKGYFEVAVDLKTGKALGNGRADDLSADDTDALWTYTSYAGQKGDFAHVFGFAHPSRNAPLPNPASPDQLNVKYEPLTDTLNLWANVGGFNWEHNMVCDHAGKPLLKWKQRWFAHVSVVGNTVRVWNGDGTFDDYDMH